VANEWASDITLVFESLSEKPGHGQVVYVRDLSQHVHVVFGSFDGASEKRGFFVLIYPELSNLGLSKECLTYRYM